MVCMFSSQLANDKQKWVYDNHQLAYITVTTITTERKTITQNTYDSDFALTT